jgi:hypothetical protein
MFLDFYQMQSEPFGVTPDPRFLYLGDSQREALASLYCGISRKFPGRLIPHRLAEQTNFHEDITGGGSTI